MGILNRNKNSLMDAIRCDEKDYLIWKWRPNTDDTNNRSNTIRWGSSLRVRDGEVAAFVYQQAEGSEPAYYEGPFDKVMETENMPVLAALVGAAYNGGSPFQAEVYFINIAGIIQLKFAVPYFNIKADTGRGYEFPIAVRGSMDFQIADYRTFVEAHQLRDFSMEDLNNHLSDIIRGTTSEELVNAPRDYGFSAVEIDSKMAFLREILENSLQNKFDKERQGIKIIGLNIAAIDIDKQNANYKKVLAFARNPLTDVGQFFSGVAESARFRKESLDKKEQINNKQPDNKETLGSKISGIFHKQTGEVDETPGATPPPIPITTFYVAEGSKQTGPFEMDTLIKMSKKGKLTASTLVWKEGMENWTKAGDVEELSSLFQITPPPIPE